MSQIKITGLLDFLKTSPTPFHATANLAESLQLAGYSLLDESQAWSLEAGGKYLVTRGQASIIAFQLPAREVIETGLVMIGAHTDSPCLKLKPLPGQTSEDYFQTGVEVYGGALLNPWFDRDLSLAGRATCLDGDSQVISILIDFERPVAVIPSLAIHLDRDVNKKKSVNAQLHLPPVWCQQSDSPLRFRDLLKTLITENRWADDIQGVLDFDLCYYDTQPPAVTGFKDEFITSARLDNLLSCYVGLRAIVDAPEDSAAMLVCTDHEEVGSQSASGANGPFLENILHRIGKSEENTQRLVCNSTMISVDNAHAVHPNYADKHDPQHKPRLNHGPVIKVNANQRYATSSETAGRFRALCESCRIPVQTMAMRSDMACGTTIGPITAARLGVRTVDIGAPQLAMHSIRELAGVKDVDFLYKALSAALRT